MAVATGQSPRFWAYAHAALYAGKMNYLAIKQTTGIQNLDSAEYLNTRVPYPSEPEQEQIAAFLDWKTGQIDALIAKKQALIEKLKEKRLAVITQAVTRGLDASAPLRNSLIPWLGHVPQHWVVGGFTKFVLHRADYRGKTPEKVKDGVFLVTARNIKSGYIDYELSQEFVLEDEYEQIMSRGKPAIGDLLFTTEAPLGEVANIDREDIALAQRVIKFRGEPNKLNNYFAKYWMMSIGFQSDLMSLATGSTAKGIKASKLFALRCVIPPLEEQGQIVEYLDRKLSDFDEMENKVISVIDKLTEYRTALITAATTGQIDVRNVKIPAQA
jgi:type I restriction enzyme S subunit